jgi:hypothetical protein
MRCFDCSCEAFFDATLRMAISSHSESDESLKDSLSERASS